MTPMNNNLLCYKLLEIDKSLNLNIDDIMKFQNNLIESIRKEVDIKSNYTNKEAQDIIRKTVKILKMYKFDYSEDLKYTYYSNGIRDKLMTCYTWTALYYSMFEAVNLIFFGVNAPEHFFLRYVNGKEKPFNFEPTATRNIKNIFYMGELKIRMSNVVEGIDMNSMNKEQIIAHYYFNMAKLYKDSNKIELSLKLLNNAIHLYPEFFLAYINRINILLDLDKLLDAERDLNILLEKHPNNTLVHEKKGELEYKRHDIKKAIDSLIKAIELDKKNAIAYLNLGKIFFFIKEREEAKMLFHKAIKINPKLKSQIPEGL